MATLDASTYKDLSHARQSYIIQIDGHAEEGREKLSTNGVNQSRVYEAKLREAQDGGGPLLEAEAESLGVSQEEVRQSVLEAYYDWKVACGAIEGLRLKAKADVRSSKSPSEMYSLMKKFKEALNVV